MRRVAPSRRRQRVSSLFGLLAAALLGCGGAPADRPPNIVLVIGDDHGYLDFGFMGSQIVQTPALDALAREGTVFTHGFVTASLCKPSLRSLLTGLQPSQWDARVAARRAVGERRPEPERIAWFDTLPRALARAGYATFQAGKLWEASHTVAGFEDGMQRRGDEAIHGGAGRSLGRDSIAPVLEFLDAPRDRPFFLWFAPMLPHVPHDPPDRTRAPYEGRGFSGSAVNYFANVTRFDEVLAQLLAALDERSLADETLVVYLADNGWDQAPGFRANRFARVAADGPRGKATPYELGTRTPIVLRWPGRVPVGAVRNDLVSSVDLFPTLLEIAGAPVPEGRPGRSLQGALAGGSGPEREFVVGAMAKARPAAGRDSEPERFVHAPITFLRTRDWYYVWQPDAGREELYDASQPARERIDLAASQPDALDGLRRRAEAWQQAMREGAVVSARADRSAVPDGS